MTRVYHNLVYSLIIIDIIAINAAIVVSYLLRFNSGIFPVQHSHPFSMYYSLMVLQTIILPPIFGAQRLYRLRRTISWTEELYQVLASVSIVSALAMTINSFIQPDLEQSRLLLALALVMSIMLVLLGRFIHHTALRFIRSKGVTADRVLVIGRDDIAQTIIDKMRGDASLGYQVVGVLSDLPITNELNFAGVPILGTVNDTLHIAREQRIDEVFIATPALSHNDLLEIISHCSGAKVGIKVYPDLFQIMASEVSISDLGGLPMITVKDLALKGWNLVLKRALDLTVSLAALIVLSPLMLLIALLIKIDSPRGPVFYTQERVGLDGKPFQILKFRSMRPDAELVTGPVWAHADDDRTTAIGKWLRRLSFDELPQFINVLIGEMSLVGPRPERPYFVEQFQQRIPRYWERHTEKAGITGWAQVNGLRGNTSIEERTAYDLWYVENWTIWLDLKIILRLPFTIFDKNAY